MKKIPKLLIEQIENGFLITEQAYGMDQDWRNRRWIARNTQAIECVLAKLLTEVNK